VFAKGQNVLCEDQKRFLIAASMTGKFAVLDGHFCARRLLLQATVTL